ncbi:hypothetical protein ALC53_03849 [Atta colombica]|uniref:STAS domain-containing protein n=1 Tax=Atta colombica TaxID=520822 RepID=A0A195BLU5_9HYME|nr:hypothetical protein ALC53_03849 [Atta colombica]
MRLTRVASMVHAAQKELASASATHTQDAFAIEGETVIVIVSEETIAFPVAECLHANVMKVSRENSCNMIILDCKNLKRLDITIAENIKLLGKDLSVRGQTIVCSNCCENVNAVLKVVAPELLNVKEDRSNHEGRIAYLTCSSI